MYAVRIIWVQLYNQQKTHGYLCACAPLCMCVCTYVYGKVGGNSKHWTEEKIHGENLYVDIEALTFPLNERKKIKSCYRRAK